MNITRKDVDGMLTRLVRAAREHGVIAADDPAAIEHGSKIGGNSYNVVTFDHENGRRDLPFGTFHFGFTARDCYDRMHAMCIALELVTS